MSMRNWILRFSSKYNSKLSSYRPRTNHPFSSSSSSLQGDAGNKATHGHHKITLLLTVLTPTYLLIPTDSICPAMPNIPQNVDQALGVVMSTLIAGHSWIGMNYVVTDYVPKVQKALVGPARLATAGMALITWVGLSLISIQSEKGFRGLIWNGLWSPKKTNEKISSTDTK